MRLKLGLPPAFAASTSGSGREWEQGLGVIFTGACCEPRGPGDVFSYSIPAPDPKPPDVADSRDWAQGLSDPGFVPGAGFLAHLG